MRIIVGHLLNPKEWMGLFSATKRKQVYARGRTMSPALNRKFKVKIESAIGRRLDGLTTSEVETALAVSSRSSKPLGHGAKRVGPVNISKHTVLVVQPLLRNVNCKPEVGKSQVTTREPRYETHRYLGPV